MVKVFKVDDRVIGKIKSNMGLKGKILQILFEGKTKKFQIEYSNGKVLTETSRAIVKEGTLPPVGGGHATSQDDGNGSGHFSDSGDDLSSMSGAENEVEEEER
jgi:hypothetical protein